MSTISRFAADNTLAAPNYIQKTTRYHSVGKDGPIQVLFQLSFVIKRFSIFICLITGLATTMMGQKSKITPVITWSSPASIAYGTPLSSIQLNATANVQGNFKYSPGSGTILNAGTNVLSATFTPIDKSKYNVATASVSIVVNEASASIILSNLTQAYTGTPRDVTVTTNPSGVPTMTTYTGIDVNYPGNTTAPINAGSYAVVSKINSSNYTGPDATGTLLITQTKKTDPVITWANPVAITYGTALNKKQLNATANVSGSFVYDPRNGTILNAGTQTLNVTFTPKNNTLYNVVSKSVQIVVNKANATITLSNLNQTYDGSSRSATVDTNPAGLSYSITYNGSGNAPVNAGAYSIVATITDPNYYGNSDGVLSVAKASATISLSDLNQDYDGSPKTVTVTTVPSGLSGVSVTYDGSTTVPSAVGLYSVVASLNNQNYEASDASGTLTIKQTILPATITLSNLNQTYDGSSRLATVVTNPAGLSYSITYNGSDDAPVNAGTYSIVATITEQGYVGNTTGALVIDKATPIVIWNDPASIVYGTTLNAGQLNATSNVAGSFTYTPSAGTLLNAGTQMLSVDFIPDDAANYKSVLSTNVSLTVGKAKLLYRADDRMRSYGQNNFSFSGRFLKSNIVILGSSTAAGTGASSPSRSWAGLLTNQLNAVDYPGQVNVINLAWGSNSTYTLLPTGTDNGSTRPAVDTQRNITAALALSPQIIIINLPSNDVSAGFTLTETMNNFATIINMARSAGVKVFLTGTQPEGDPQSYIGYRMRLYTMNQELLNTYGSDCINVYDELVQLPDYWLKDVYNSGDYTHLSDSGHAYLYSQIYPPVKAWIEVNGSGFVNNETIADLSGIVIFFTEANSTSPAGRYPIIPSGLRSSNYDITYANGVLTVTKAIATITLSDLLQVYDGSPKSPTVTTNPEGLSYSITYNGSTTQPIDTGSYSVVATITQPNYRTVSTTGIFVIAAPATPMVTAWPNPVTSSANIRITSDKTERVLVSIYTLNGVLIKQLYNGEIVANTGKNMRFDASGLANGLYVLRTRIGSQTVSQLIMVAK